MIERVIAATDGSAQPNPGPTAWAWVLADSAGKPCQGQSGFMGDATNNVGELMAVAMLLGTIDRAIPLEIRIDSQYALNAVTAWLPKQRERGYTTTAGKPIANRDLIVRIDELLKNRDVVFTWVRAHQANGDLLNAAADVAAQDAVRRREGHTWTAEEFAAVTRGTGTPAALTGDPAAALGGCRATTRTGKPCAIEPRPSGLCHVHDPAVQCRAITGKGNQCTVPTGGGRCGQHQAQLW